MLARLRLLCYTDATVKPTRDGIRALGPPRGRLVWNISLSLASLLLLPAVAAAAANDQPVDLTGKVTPIVTFKSRDNFSNEYRYEVTLRNVGSEPIAGDSLLVVLDRVMNVGGEDREPLKNESLLRRMEILDADGETEEGKPFFRVAVDGAQDLLPQSESRPVTVRLRNRDYVQVFTPVFRAFGVRRLPPPPRILEVVPPTAAAPAHRTPNGKLSVEKLLQLLIKKGVLTEEEARTLSQPAP